MYIVHTIILWSNFQVYFCWIYTHDVKKCTRRINLINGSKFRKRRINNDLRQTFFFFIFERIKNMTHRTHSLCVKKILISKKYWFVVYKTIEMRYENIYYALKMNKRCELLRFDLTCRTNKIAPIIWPLLILRFFLFKIFIGRFFISNFTPFLPW